MRTPIILFSIILSANAYAECETTIECVNKISQEIESQKQDTEKYRLEIQRLEKQIAELKQQVGTNKLLQYRDFPKNTLSINANNDFEFKIDIPGLLIASLSTHNNEGNSVGGGQHTISAASRIYVNGVLCAVDTSSLYVWDGGTQSDATCIAELKKGTNTVSLRPQSNTAAGRAQRWGRFVVLPISGN